MQFCYLGNSRLFNKAGTQNFDQEVQHFHALPCVCKLFQSIFDDQPDLYSALSLGEHLDCKHLSGLYHWAQKHGHSVEHLLALSGSPYLEAALTALQSNKSQHEPARLTTLCIAHTRFSDYELRPVSDAAVVLLTPFTSLVSFTLDAGGNAQSPCFNLYALQGLPLLSRLSLTGGTYQEIEAAEHLTHLSIHNSHADCFEECKCVSSLIELSLTDAGLQNLHAQGICACSRLQVLKCIRGFVNAVNSVESMAFCRDSDPLVPNSLSLLTCLTQLEVFYIKHSIDFEVGWLAQLPFLQCLRVTLDVHVAHFPEQLSVLTHLTQLQVSNNVPGAHMHFAVDWARLAMLQSLWIGSQATFSQPLTSLVLLSQLRTICFVLSGDTAAQTATQIASLAHKLGSTRPDVAFSTRVPYLESV